MSGLEVTLTPNALRVLRARYLRTDSTGSAADLLHLIAQCAWERLRSPGRLFDTAPLPDGARHSWLSQRT